KARDIAQHAADLSPEDPAPYGILADANLETGQYEAAIAALETMVHLKPNLASYSRISYVRELHGDIDGAIEAMEMAIRAGGPKSENTAWCVVHLGNLYLNSSRLALAEESY